jgi:2',3'-cyclic-nucleotide 2'-phosphodiesterase
LRLLFIGDVVGRSGRQAVFDRLPGLRQRYRPDAVILNGENAAGGFGITPAICQELYAAGVDVVTLGNHAWDQREIIGHIDGDPRLVRPLNLLPGTPGRGIAEVELPRGGRLVVIQVIGRLFMGHGHDDPFRALDAALARYISGPDVIVVDLHAEATSEKAALGHMLDGRVALAAGTHTHVPTADAWIMPGGTAYISDVGMTGDYDSVIGMDKGIALARFRSSVPGPRLAPATGDATLCAVLLDTDSRGLAAAIHPIRTGGRLPETLPEIQP